MSALKGLTCAVSSVSTPMDLTSVTAEVASLLMLMEHHVMVRL